MDENGVQIGQSKKMAVPAIAQVVISRIAMATPYLGNKTKLKIFIELNFKVATPVIISLLEKKYWFKSRPWLTTPTQMAICGIILTFSTPLCCALYPQNCSVKVTRLFGIITLKFSPKALVEDSFLY